MPRKTQVRDKDSRRRPGGRFSPMRKKTCRFCADKKLRLDYKSPQQMTMFITERGKILPRRFTGACAKHQRDITLAVKRARILAVVPFAVTQVRTF